MNGIAGSDARTRLRLEVEAGSRRPYHRLVTEARAFSMLHEDVLQLLAHFAATTDGAILEIGPYVGGSTVALAAGNAARARPFVTVEAGGAYKEHPHIPSDNIIRDLRRNLRRFGMEDVVSVVRGWCYNSTVRRTVAGRSCGEKIGLLIIDADGLLEPTLHTYSDLLRDDCVIVIDDYESAGSAMKEALVRPFVRRQVEAGTFIEYGIFGWGTWFGRLAGPEAIATLRTSTGPFPKGLGFSYLSFLDTAEPGDTLTNLTRSPTRFFEDEVELGPGHALHKAIRNHGNGRFSHWATGDTPTDEGLCESMLVFSSSDNTDPNGNGRRYRLAVQGQWIELNAQPSSALTFRRRSDLSSGPVL
jgi:predicted O-methyltransferase YrrM